jgi:membrane associated rhomboid family serine protease
MAVVPIGFIPLFFRIPAVVFAVIWFALQLVQGSFELATPSMAAGVAWWAHIGGFAFGALFAVAVGSRSPESPTPTVRWTDARGRRVPDIRSENVYVYRDDDGTHGPWGRPRG